MLALSIVFSVLVHASLLAIAPRVSISGIHPAPAVTPEYFRVQFRDEAPPPPPPAPEKRPGKLSSLSTGPGKIEDQLKRENEPLSAGESTLGKALDVPRLSDRVASEVLEREHALTAEPEVLEQVDAKIVEIEQSAAREGIEIPRRLVTPSPERIIAENEFPALRGPSDAEVNPIALANLDVTTTLGDAARAPAGGAQGPEGAPVPPHEDNVVAPQVAVPDEPVLPEIQELGRSAIVEQVRKENPYQFMDDLVDIKIDTYVPPNEKEGFFRLQILPKKGESIPVLPKDVTFVIDASNSIVQHKLDMTAKAARSMVAQLKPEDRFNIVVFRDSPSFFQPGAVPGTPENKNAAVQFLTGIKSGGQTDVYNALRPVIDSPPRKGVPGIIVVMSDGRPTIGVRDARTLINQISEENNAGNTIFAYGAGNTVNGYLLDLLAYRNRGEAKVLPSFENTAKELPEFFSRLNDPILAELHANYGKAGPQDSIVPKNIPDFYKGRAVTVYGQFRPSRDGEFFMRLVGTAESSKKEVIFKADLRKAATGDEKIARNWAFERIYFLIGEVCRLGEKPELLAELRQLSQKYNIRTSYSE